MPTKRSSPASGSSTRKAKAAKTNSSSTPYKSRTGGKKGVKPVIAPAAFEATAEPLYVNVTHTPPTTVDEASATASVDPGFVGNLTLVPSLFSTGSYGWKGNKRITVELQDSENGISKTKVQVMLTINATVLGSKKADSGEGDQVDGDRDVTKTEVEADVPKEETSEADD